LAQPDPTQYDKICFGYSQRGDRRRRSFDVQYGWCYRQAAIHWEWHVNGSWLWISCLLRCSELLFFRLRCGHWRRLLPPWAAAVQTVIAMDTAVASPAVKMRIGASERPAIRPLACPTAHCAAS